MSQLALGTVQFGSDYGISNPKGKVPIDEVGEILEFCKRTGIDVLDTAQGYGDSESVLGQFNLDSFKIVTKLMGGSSLELSLKNLNCESVYAVLFHRENECTDESWKVFEAYKSQGMVKKIGVSVYSPDVLVQLLGHYPLDLVQLPMNMLDQRFVDILPVLKKHKVEVHVRSVFLQGLLLMDNIPSYFDPIVSVINKLPKPRLAHALQFVANQDVSRIVVGVTSLKELRGISSSIADSLEPVDYGSCRIDDQRFINPSLWKV